MQLGNVPSPEKLAAYSRATSSTKHHIQFSPGSIDCITGCLVALKCLVACLFFDESQQPTCPHSRHSRKCTHVSPIFRHSSQPFVCGRTSLMWLMCEQPLLMTWPPAPVLAGCWHEISAVAA